MKEQKLIIQIPCYNEEETLASTIKNLPETIEGISGIEVLIVNDGSLDRTTEIAHSCGVTHIVNLKKRSGLAAAFSTGIDASLKLGADIIVNTDADNQYKGEDIKKLIQPILEGKADLVIGSRNIDKIKQFSFLKKKLQKMGSGMVRYLSGLDIPDATTGFRAYTKEAALKLNVVSEFTYTLETLIAAGNTGLTVKSVGISTNPVTRRSRLFKSIPEYIIKSAATLTRIYTMYRPLKVFARIGAIIFAGGIILGVRFLYFYLLNKGYAGHIQSLILSAVFIILGFQVILLGLLADLIASNRKLIETTLTRVKKMELDKESH